MGEIEPASDDASLSAVLVHRADGLAHRPLERNQPTAGISPAIAGVLINRSKEPDAGPHVRFCEKHGGVILRAYSTCAWHGHWIGGVSPSRGELVATASQRQLHAVGGVVRRQPAGAVRPCGEEARGKPWHRTKVNS